MYMTDLQSQSGPTTVHYLPAIVGRTVPDHLMLVPKT